MTWVAGADGFKSRWVVVLRNLATGDFRCRVVASFSDLLALDECPAIVAVDIPIGLPEVTTSGGRACERFARGVLGPRRSSVFNPVGRQTLRAATRSDASLSSTAAGGIGIGAQAWGLAAKLREADEAMTPDAQRVVREAHPEVCFWAMNGGVPMAFAKTTEAGHQERKAALVQAGFPAAFVDTMPPGIRVGRDDFLDACTAVWTAERIARGVAQRFPPDVDRDARGLDQTIWSDDEAPPSTPAVSVFYIRSMGRMKDQLGDAPPTIGDLRRQGVVAFRVRCARPCKRIGRVTLDALRLPNNTIIRQIPKLRRLRCEACDRCVPELEPIWPASSAEPPGAHDMGSARWTLVIEDPNGRAGVSSPFWSRLHAAQSARRHLAEGSKVVRVETPTGDIEADQVAAWLASAERS